MTRLSFKTTAKAKAVMQAVAELNHQDIADIVHSYFYDLARSHVNDIVYAACTDDELLDIFSEAIAVGCGKHYVT